MTPPPELLGADARLAEVFSIFFRSILRSRDSFPLLTSANCSRVSPAACAAAPILYARSTSCPLMA